VRGVVLIVEVAETSLLHDSKIEVSLYARTEELDTTVPIPLSADRDAQIDLRGVFPA
jgi:hypothetical protein